MRLSFEGMLSRALCLGLASQCAQRVCVLQPIRGIRSELDKFLRDIQRAREITALPVSVKVAQTNCDARVFTAFVPSFQGSR